MSVAPMIGPSTADRPMIGPNMPKALGISSSRRTSFIIPKPCGIISAPKRPAGRASR